MRRRDFVAGLGLAVLLGDKAAGKPSLIGILNSVSEQDLKPWLTAFLDGMLAFGYAEGRDIDILSVSANGDHTQLPRLSEELVRLQPRIIVANSAFGTAAVKHAT